MRFDKSEFDGDDGDIRQPEAEKVKGHPSFGWPFDAEPVLGHQKPHFLPGLCTTVRKRTQDQADGQFPSTEPQWTCHTVMP